MMFGVHGGEEVGGGLVPGFLLPAAPMQEEAVADAAEHPDDPHRVRQAHAALVGAVRDIQALVQTAFDAPGGPVARQPLRGVQLGGRQARHQRDGFRRVLAQVPAQERVLGDARKVHRLGAAGQGAQDAQFGLAFVELAFTRQRGRGFLRGGNPPEVREYRAIAVINDVEVGIPSDSKQVIFAGSLAA